MATKKNGTRARRPLRLPLYVSAADLALIEPLARLAGLPVATFVRNSAIAHCRDCMEPVLAAEVAEASHEL